MERRVRGIVLVLALLLPALAGADEPSGGAAVEPAEAEGQGRPWYVPDYLKLQFAGAIGFLSAGAGYAWWGGHAETDAMLGFVPPFDGDGVIVSLTAKQTFRFFDVKLGGRFSTRPLGLGLFLNYTFGPDYALLQPEHYPEHYYPWSTALRVGLFLGGDVGAELRDAPLSRVDLYWELGTVDLEFVSLLANPEYLGLLDVLNLAVGVRLSF